MIPPQTIASTTTAHAKSTQYTRAIDSACGPRGSSGHGPIALKTRARFRHSPITGLVFGPMSAQHSGEEHAIHVPQPSLSPPIIGLAVMLLAFGVLAGPVLLL